MFLDNDDEYVKEACEIFYKAISEKNVNLIVGSKINYMHTPNDLPQNIDQNPEFTEKNVLKNPEYLFDFIEYSGAMWCKIFKREFLIKNNIKYLENLPEDTYFMHHCYYLNSKALFIKNLKLYNYYYRNNEKSVSSTLSSFHLTKGFLSFNELEKLSKENSNSVKLFSTFVEFFLNIYSYQIIVTNGFIKEKY